MKTTTATEQSIELARHAGEDQSYADLAQDIS